MKIPLRLLALAASVCVISTAFAASLTPAGAIALLSPSNHVVNPTGWGHANPTEEQKRMDALFPQQMAAIEYIRANKIEEAIPNLILYIDYARHPGMVDPAHCADLNNVKNNYIAFGALLEMPTSAPILKAYCSNDKIPIADRLAALHALKYVNKQDFDDCWKLLKSSQSNVKVQQYLDGLKDPRAQFMGVPDLQ